MVEIKYLEPNDPDPDAEDNVPWMVVEPFDSSGKFYGTGGGHKPDGNWVNYASLAENDASLGLALAAAVEWAEKHRVLAVYVRVMPKNT